MSAPTDVRLPTAGRPRTEMNDILRQLQIELESRGGPPELVRYRRALLRGFRAASWALMEKPPVDDVRRLLFEELFTSRNLP